jgi:hypothetical protein
MKDETGGTGITDVGNERGIQKFVLGICVEKRWLERLRCIREGGYIKTDFGEIVCESVDRIKLVQDWGLWLAFVKNVMMFQGSVTVGNILELLSV